MRTKPKQVPSGKTYLDLWETEYKPNILTYYQVPLEIVANVLGVSVTKVQEQLRSGLYSYGIARPCKGGQYAYEVYPLWLIKFVEQGNIKPLHISYGDCRNDYA
jgi:hypothetical protein